MQTYIAILRGINVSGKNKIPMAELRDLLGPLKFQDVQTYIQSGNVIFKAPKEDCKLLSQKIHNRIRDHFNYQVPVIVLEPSELQKAVSLNPYDREDISKLSITFLAEKPATELVKALPVSSNPRESFEVNGKVIYVYCPDGYGRSKISNMFFERKLKVTATTRNWKTCLKLLELSS